jgi:glycolate oxidase iron-sulfur subunit
MLEKRGIRGLPAFLLWTAQKLRLAPKGFPKVSLRSLDSSYHGTYLAQGSKRARVAYFTGCATNSMDTETGISVMKVLSHNGIEVVLPEGLKCCGIPALGEGDIETAQKLTRNNLSILCGLEVDAVVTDCTSCGMMLRSEAAKVLPPDDPLLLKALELSPRIYEVTDYLGTIGITGSPGPLEGSYTYHVPCHRGWTATMVDAPVKVLSRIPGLKYLPMEEPEKCCGAGGAFYMEYSDLSQKIRKRKADDINGTGASLLVSQCPGCRSYLSAAVCKRMETVHPLTLLRRAYGL